MVVIMARKEKDEIAQLIKKLSEYEVNTEVNHFKEFPLSRGTLKGLTSNGYTKPTEIQAQAIGLALKGFDILGAAKTGSGKTLAFIVPLIEKLYREKWTHLDGLGALIITPTRELAYQIFEVINKVGANHHFSVGLVIGGKDLKFERTRLNKCNIMICTPGRLLQHMNENPLFVCDNIQMLILDEADRILDMGFSKTVDAILENLPIQRQTLLFSATQTKSVRDLARLSLKDPKYVAVHEHCKTVTPEGLTQSYIVCDLADKIIVLWSFIKSHLGQKILVFVSTCKQAKYLHELFCRLKPGTSLLALYGTLHQMRRMKIYDEFCKKHKAVLIATDIAARGLDFPAVNWVIQLDCPEDTNAYIHRVGRTARFQKDGESLLVLLPSEEKSMIAQLEAKKVPIENIEVNPKKMKTIQRKAEALCARDPNLKESGQRAFKAYLKDVFYMKDKSVFDINALDREAYARSLGLAVAPRVRFLEKKGVKLSGTSNQNSQESKPDEPVKKHSKGLSLTGDASEESDGEELFVSKKVPSIPDLDTNKPLMADKRNKSKVISQSALAKKVLRKKLKVNSRIVFDEQGNPVEEVPRSQKSEKLKLLEEKSGTGIDLELAKEIMEEEDLVDKEIQRKLIKEKHKEKRLKLKEEQRLKKEENKLKANQKGKKPTMGKASLVPARSEASSDSDVSETESLDNLIDALPDPDRIYGNKGSDQEEEDDQNDYGSSSDEPEPVSESIKSKKRPSKIHKKRKRSTSSEDGDIPLQNTEELALQLLSA